MTNIIMEPMPLNDKSYSQFELFPSSSKNIQEIERSSILLKDLTLSTENIIVVAIVFIMASVLFFSFGVERGKRLVKPGQAASKINSADSSKDVIITPSNSSAIVEQVAPIATNPMTAGTQPAKMIQQPALKPKEEGPQPVEVRNNYTVQVASFKQQKQAEKEAMVLKQKGFESIIHKKGGYAIVCVGKFSLKEEAQKLSSKLQKQYKDCLVRRF